MVCGEWYRLSLKKVQLKPFYCPTGPAVELVLACCLLGMICGVMGGGYNRGFDPLFDNIGYYQFTEGRWKNRGNNPLTDNMRDFTHPAYSKNLNELVIATQSYWNFEF